MTEVGDIIATADPAVSVDGWPPGTMLPFLLTTAPSGWSIADGTPVSRAANPNLLAVLTVALTGTLTVGSKLVTGMASTAKLWAGLSVEGPNIPANTTIQSVDSGTQITLSQNATASGPVTVTSFLTASGDGSTTFNLPNPRQNFIIGAGTAATGLGTPVHQHGRKFGTIDHVHAAGSITCNHRHGKGDLSWTHGHNVLGSLKVSPHTHNYNTGWNAYDLSHGGDTQNSYFLSSNGGPTGDAYSGDRSSNWPYLGGSISSQQVAFDASNSAYQNAGAGGNTAGANPPFLAMNWIVKLG